MPGGGVYTQSRRSVMSNTTIGRSVLVVFLGMLMIPGVVLADACLMAYPTGLCEYHYSSLDKYTVGPGHPLYDPLFDLGGVVLIKIDPIDGDGIALDVYQAPGLTGFVLDEVDQGYFAFGVDYDLVIDGYSNVATTYTNILLVFDGIEPDGCTPLITVDGQPALFDAGLGYYYPIGDLVVETPTPVGNAFSDTVILTIGLQACTGVRVWAFSDSNSNLMHDLPGECFTAFSHDVTVPVQETTWGAIKSLYQ
jgi:hypothetical protein